MATAQPPLLEQAFTRLDAKLPAPVGRVLRRLRKPGARCVRIPIGVLCLFASLLWFLPGLGIWMLPVGLLFLAQDIRVLRKPVGRMLLWMLDRWDALVARFRRWRRRGSSH